jgi:hypothetical protein
MARLFFELRGLFLAARCAFLFWRAESAHRHADAMADVFNGACDHADALARRADLAHRAHVQHEARRGSQ